MKIPTQMPFQAVFIRGRVQAVPAKYREKSKELGRVCKLCSELYLSWDEET
jgi:hypothetical protein